MRVNRILFRRVNRTRGQITIFVILGIVLLIGAGFYIYYTNRIKSSSITVPQYTGDFGRVQTFVDDCMEQVGRQGITELGRHGGYIDPMNNTYTPISIATNQIDQTESDMAFLNSKDSATGIPYWYYSKSRSGCWHCDVSSLSPTISSMETQLGLYMDSNIEQCLDNYNSFKGQGLDISEILNSSTRVNITESSVNFLNNYSVMIKKTDGEVNYINLFYKEVDIPLMQYYLIATNITQNEIDKEYLDVYALYLLGQYNGLNENKLPPLSAYQTGYDPVFWSKTNVRSMYESLLSSYIPFFKIKGTKNDLNISGTSQIGPIESNMRKAMSMSMFDEKSPIYSELKYMEINHIYLGQSIYLDVRPSNGDLISPFVTKDTSEFGKVLMGVQPDQDYDFFYDISYPVVVEIKDTRPGKEYEFMFALQGNIKENKLLSDWLVGLGTIPWNNDYVKLRNDIPNNTTIFDPETGENITYQPTVPTKNFFCDEAQKISGNVTLKTYDMVTEKPLTGVSVTYNCGTYASCYLDVTRNDTSNKASFNEKLPLCENGYIELEKENYLTKRIQFTTAYQQSNYIGSIYMEPVITKNISIKKYNVSRLGTGYVLGQPVELSENDSVILTFNKIPFDALDEPWTQTLVFGKNAIGTNMIDLVSGAYSVDAQLLDYNGVIIPKECQEICVGPIIKCSKTIKIPENDIIINVSMQGGISFNESDPFIITTGDLINNNSLEVYVVRMPNPRCLNDMNEASLTGYMAKKYPDELIPKFQ